MNNSDKDLVKACARLDEYETFLIERVDGRWWGYTEMADHSSPTLAGLIVAIARYLESYGLEVVDV